MVLTGCECEVAQIELTKSSDKLVTGVYVRKGGEVIFKLPSSFGKARGVRGATNTDWALLLTDGETDTIVFVYWG